MAKKENMDFLQESYQSFTKKTEINNYESLCNWYFGTEERSIKVCAHRAYRDFCRRLTGIGKLEDNLKNKYRKVTEGHIENWIKDLLGDKQEFDFWHENTCRKIMKAYETYEMKSVLTYGFPYGLAQKWLNMTMKYMLIMEKWDSQMQSMRNQLHVPVDDYIMEAASDELHIYIPYKNGEEGNYNKGKVKPWSQWDYDEYKKFQDDIRSAVACPIEWEGPAWIKVAQKRKVK